MPATLVVFHVPARTGYAIGPLEGTFRCVAEALTPGRVHFSYVHTRDGRPDEPKRVIDFDPRTEYYHELLSIEHYVRTHGIDLVLGFDQPVGRPYYEAVRRAGVRTIVSYWGAPMSSINKGPKLWAKRVECALREGPDHYIFESRAMRRRATHGRGVSARRTSVVPLGVDTRVFRPNRPPFDFTALGIPAGRKVVFFSGHVGEPRKGCDVLMRAAVRLAEQREDFHFLLCGNKPGDEAWLVDILSGHRGADHVTFGGYRGDLPEIMPSCYVGIVASTGWDSFPRSSLEMQACGLPVIVSDLDGLPETIEDGATGIACPVGDSGAVAACIASLLDDPTMRNRMSDAARMRATERFAIEHQVDALAATCRRVHDGAH